MRRILNLIYAFLFSGVSVASQLRNTLRANLRLEQLEGRTVPNATFRWEPGEINKNWENGNNWFLLAGVDDPDETKRDNIPDADDQALFDGTINNANSNNRQVAEVKDLVIQGGYTGTLFFYVDNFKVNHELKLNGADTSKLHGNTTGMLLRTKITIEKGQAAANLFTYSAGILKLIDLDIGGGAGAGGITAKINGTGDKLIDEGSTWTNKAELTWEAGDVVALLGAVWKIKNESTGTFWIDATGTLTVISPLTSGSVFVNDGAVRKWFGQVSNI